MYDLAPTLNRYLCVVPGGTVLALARNDCTHSANLSFVVQHELLWYSIAVLRARKQAKIGENGQQ
jgi:hypothetical protein